MPIAASSANDKKFGYIYKRTKRVEGNPAIVLFGGQVDTSGRLSVQIPDIKGYTIAKLSAGNRDYDWLLSYTKNGSTFTFDWQDFRLLLDELSVTTYENVPADALNASKLVSQVITRSEPWAKFPEFMAQFPVNQWFAANVNNSRYITERQTTRYKYREIKRDDIIVAKGVKLYEIDTIEEFTERVYLEKRSDGTYRPQLVPMEYVKTVYTKQCLTRWQEVKEISINKGQNTKSSGYLFQQKKEVRDVYSIPDIQYRPPAYPVTQKPLLAKVQTGRAGVSNFVQSRDFQSASTLTSIAELAAYAKWLGETRWQRYYSREIACGYTATLGYAPFQGVLAGNGLFIRDRFGISLNNEGDSWQFVEDCIGNKIATVPEIAAPPIPFPPLLISTLNIAAIANHEFIVGSPISAINLYASGGAAPYTFSSTILPTGLSISGTQIVGTPSAIATTSVTVTVTDSLSDTDTTTFDIAIVAAPVPVAIVEVTQEVNISVGLDVSLTIENGIPIPIEINIDLLDVRVELGGITSRLINANYAALTNTTFARLVSRNYGEIAAVAPSSLLAYWKMDETGGDTVDRADSVGSFDFVPSTNASLTHDIGRIGNALRFPSVTATGIAALTDGATKITKVFWFKAPSVSTGGSDYLITRYPEVDPFGFNVYENEIEPDVFEYELYFTGKETSTATPYLTNSFCFICIYFDLISGIVLVEITGRRYADGLVETVSLNWVTTASTATDMQLSNSIIDFTIDEVALYNRELTSLEKAQLYNNFAGTTYPSVPL